jgi:hypothetical protein
MIDSFAQLADILDRSHLEGVELPILGGKPIALSLRVEPSTALAEWQTLYDRLPETGRYPVLVTCWRANRENWRNTLLQEDLFNRFSYQYELNFDPKRDTSPLAIIDRANYLDLSDCLEHLPHGFDEDWQDWIPFALADTQTRFGLAPTLDAVHSAIAEGAIANYYDLERWLFRWEMEQFGKIRLGGDDLGYLDWFEPVGQLIALLLLPTSHSWEALAYLHWYGADTCGTELAIALLRRWHEHYGANLVAHYGTMLQLIADHPPVSAEEAFNLAWEQVKIAPCTILLPGVSLRYHGRSLLSTPRWFLHERP